ncbi:MAG: zeta toxin family protein [Pseudomonadota bacterium]
MLDPVLIDRVERLTRRLGRPAVVGIAGAQGSGKTTLARAVAARMGGAAFSLDDVYLTRIDRQAMAARVHPLFAVRGAPGTHDLDLAHATLDSLRAGRATSLPRFDKLADDRATPVLFAGPAEVILIDGWCLGALPQDETALIAPVNALERDSDRLAVWRAHANKALAGPYQVFFDRLDAIIHLAAPSFDTVLDWRCEQEAELMGLSPAELPEARRGELARFIQHFERITRHMLAGGLRADMTVPLAIDRSLLA